MNTPWRYFDLANPTYERLTDRARLTFALAEQFAIEQRAARIEPAHILRGLASNGCGVGRTVLQEMGIDLLQLLPEIVELLPRFPEKALPPIDVLAANSGQYFVELKLGTGSIECLDAARRSAEQLDHHYLGTEHLVMGLIAGQSPAATFLRACGATDELFKAGVVRLLGGGS